MHETTHNNILNKAHSSMVDIYKSTAVSTKTVYK